MFLKRNKIVFRYSEDNYLKGNVTFPEQKALSVGSLYIYL